MNKKRKLSLFSLPVIAILIVTGFAGCKKSDTLGPLAGLLVKYEGCKQTADANNNSRGNEVFATQANDCLEFNYDGASILTLKHIDSCFNCCPGTLTADIVFNGNQITITEKENQQGCHCLCLFDVYYEIKNLTPGSYTIRIIEANINETDQVMEFTINLLSVVSGSRCVTRNHYPWIK